MTKRSPLLTASALAFALAGAAGAGAARADELVVPKATPAAAEPEAPAPQAPANWLVYNERPITLSKGMLLLHGDLVANLSSGHGGKPIWLTPNVYFGATDDLTIGVAGNTDAEFFPIGGGFCFGGTYCSNHVLNKGSVDLLLSLLRASGSAMALHAGADITNFSPFQLAVRGGVLMRFTLAGPLALLADPWVSVYVLQREPGAQEFLNVPLRLGFQVNDQVNAGLATGLNAPLDTFSTAYAIPVGVMVLLTPNQKLDVGFDFTLANVGGKHAAGVGAFTNRSIALTVNYRL
jgi:hypothetical protein